MLPLYMWQDWVIAIIQWVFVAALVPTVIHKTHKPAFWSALLTAVSATILAYTFSTLNLWQSAIGCAASSLMWYVLLYQRWRLNQKEKHSHSH